MKKLILVSAAVLLTAGMLFAGGNKDAAASTQPTVRLITDATGIDDKSFNAAAWRGILEFYGDTWENQKNRGKLYEVVTCETRDMYVPNLKQAADKGYDLIIVTGFTFADAVGEVAPLYPDQNFMIVDVDWVSKPNLAEYVYSEEQGSFLVGAAAALQAQAEGVKNPKFGFIGGVPGATITKFEMGYVQGIRAVLPKAEIVDYYANDWGAPEKAKAQAKNWYDSGVTTIFSAAGGTGNGTIAQAKEYRSQGKKVWAIGVDSDQYTDGIYADGKSAVLTSMIKKVETSTFLSLKAVADKSFKGGVYKLDLAGKGVDYSTTNKELKSEVVKKVNAMKADIISGKIKVIGTYKEALAAGLVPAGLGAKDD
ncbi:BMP family ABC transporter substrate-binding protein [Treponema sp. HNW]|uniref:BMP family lipoprotein n=1 Tax=Treponema sp. HNW TaxID=3116654 RepID=UPI003D0A9CFC